MEIKKNDFVEIEFTGKITGTDEVFDTNIKADAEKANLDAKDIKPFIMSVGQKMLPTGFDDDLVGKEAGKEYTLDLTPEKAFGKRNPQMVRMVPTKLFHEQNINPERGMQLSLDGQLTRILSSSGGRTLVDFNNPLAGKKVTYTYKIIRVVEEDKEKVNAIQDFLFRRRFDFDSNEKKITFKIEKEFEPVMKMFSEKLKEILGKDIDFIVVEKKKDEKKSEKKEEKKE